MSYTPRRTDLYAPQNRVRQIHCIGDSITYGGGVMADNAFPRHLENALHATFPGDLFVCNNMGHEGWNLWNSTLLHEATQSDQPPDLVVLTVCTNDSQLLGAFGVDYSSFGRCLDLWTPLPLQTLADRALATFREHLKKTQTKGIVLFYQTYREIDHPISSILEHLCAKNELPFWDATSHIQFNLKMPPDQQYVCAGDKHPSPACHEAIARALAIKVKEEKLLEPRNIPQTVVTHLEGATQEMINNGAYPQHVFLWCYHTINQKKISLMRSIQNREERNNTKQALNKLAEKLHSSWLDWQRRVWIEDSLSQLQKILPELEQIINPIQNYALQLLETTKTAKWAAESGLFQEWEKNANSCYPEENHEIFSEPTSLLEGKERLTRFLTLLLEAWNNFRPQPVADCLFSVPPVSTANDPLKEYILLTIETTRKSLSASFDVIESTFPPLDPTLSNRFRDYLASLIYRCSWKIEALLKTLTENSHFLKTTDPLLGADAIITVKSDNVSPDYYTGVLLSIQYFPAFPCCYTGYKLNHMIDYSKDEEVYRMRLPLFARGDLTIFLRQGKNADFIKKHELHIVKVETRPVFAGIEGPCDAGVVLFSLDASKGYYTELKLSNYSFNIPVSVKDCYG